MRTYSPSPSVHVPDYPLYLMGALGLQGLGTAAAAIGVTAGAAGKALPTLFPASSIAGPIGLGIAVLGALIAGFWSAHNARVAGAKDENAEINSAVSTFDQSIRAVFTAANSSDPSQNITPQQAIGILEQIQQTFWSAMLPHQSGPGRADASHGGVSCAGLKCDKSCTAGCCVGCFDINPTISDAIAVFQANGGTVNVRKVYGSSYGAQTREGYTLTYAPPAIAASSAAAAPGSVASTVPAAIDAAVSSILGPNLTSARIAGIPIWLIGAGVLLYALR